MQAPEQIKIVDGKSATAWFYAWKAAAAQEMGQHFRYEGFYLGELDADAVYAGCQGGRIICLHCGKQYQWLDWGRGKSYAVNRAIEHIRRTYSSTLNRKGSYNITGHGLLDQAKHMQACCDVDEWIHQQADAWEVGRYQWAQDARLQGLAFVGVA